MDPSPHSAGYNPFRITEGEIRSGGFKYLGEGVYLFTLIDDNGMFIRDFGHMLAEFRHSHPNLQQESMASAGMFMSGKGSNTKMTAYYVTFREKK